MRVLATGVELRRSDEPGYLIAGQVFADVEDGGRRERWYGTVHHTDDDAPREEDPSPWLYRYAGETHAEGVGTLLGDLHIAGYDVTRDEFYGAPVRVEIDRDLLGS